MSLKAVIVGFGSIARYGHLPWYLSHKHVELTAVIEPYAAGRVLARDVLPDAKVYETLHEAFISCPIDFVDVATPPIVHSDTVTAAILANVSVFCEKPFVTSWKALENIKVLRGSQGPLIGACHNWYFAPAIRRALDVVSQGIIGQPERILFTALRPHSPAGAGHWNPDWRQDPDQGGGILADLAYHGMYISSRIFGMAPTSAYVDPQHVKRTVRGAESAVVLNLDYGRGKIAELRVSWHNATRETGLLVSGTEGYLQIKNEHMQVQGKYDICERYDSLVADSWHATWIGDALSQFVELMALGEPASFWEDIERTVATLDAANKSVKSGTVIPVPRAME